MTESRWSANVRRSRRKSIESARCFESAWQGRHDQEAVMDQGRSRARDRSRPARPRSFGPVQGGRRSPRHRGDGHDQPAMTRMGGDPVLQPRLRHGGYREARRPPRCVQGVHWRVPGERAAHPAGGRGPGERVQGRMVTLPLGVAGVRPGAGAPWFCSGPEGHERCTTTPLLTLGVAPGRAGGAGFGVWCRCDLVTPGVTGVGPSSASLGPTRPDRCHWWRVVSRVWLAWLVALSVACVTWFNRAGVGGAWWGVLYGVWCVVLVSALLLSKAGWYRRDEGRDAAPD